MRRCAGLLALLLLATTAFSQVDLVNVKQWKVADGGNDHWYALIIDMNYWDDALYIAGTLDAPAGSVLSSKGHLATILSAQENSFIMQNIISGTGGVFSDQFWIGGYFSFNGWIWTTNEPMSYTHWGSGEPNNMGLETAMSLWGASLSYAGLWNNSFNGDGWALHMRQRAVVEWGPLDSTSLVTPPPPPICCLTQWKSADGGNNHWYALLNQQMTWEEAAAAVFQMTHIPQPGTRHQPYMASLNSAEENAFVLNSVLTGGSPGKTVWLGARHGHYHVMTGKRTPQWVWLSNEPFYGTHWAPGGNDTGLAATMIDRGGVGPAGSVAGDWLSTHFYMRYWSIIEWGNPYCGDVDDSKRVNVVDVSQFLQWLAAKGSILAPQNADATGDGTINIADAVRIVAFIFQNGGPLACAEW
ncbi:MAG: dockerin type I domain-containing protein [Candidatus Zixiibacteriota bacterium]